MSGTADVCKKILIVDDEPEIVELLQRFLARIPHETYAIRTAASGEEAMACLLEEAPDLVLLDINLPGMNGVEVLKQIDRTIPVMIVSANVDSLPAEALKHGAFAYIPKPFDFTYVEQLVPLALTQRRPPKVWVSESGV